MKGVFFEVTIPVKSDIFVVIPWNKMESRWFGINKNGIFSMDKDSEEVLAMTLLNFNMVVHPSLKSECMVEQTHQKRTNL